MASLHRVASIKRSAHHIRLSLRQSSFRHAATLASTTGPPASEQNAIESSAPNTSRWEGIRQAKPFSAFLTDNFDRQHDYLRISLTERCNLRCLYCMPEEGIQLSPNRDILTSAEIFYISSLFVNQGVNKIRLTGGEPTVRKDIVLLMQQIGSLRSKGLRELALTTNGIALHRKLDDMVEAGLTGVNISLDTLDPFQFQLLTRRQGFEAVMKSITRVQEMNRLGAGIKLKINCVAMRGLNDEQILPFVEMTKDQDMEVRFIEYMPFGGNKWSQKKMLPYTEMLDMIRVKYPTIAALKGHRNDTSKTWQIPGFQGRVGFITSMTNDFCGSCNRLRITSDGNLKVCLHGNAEVSLRDLLREGNSGEPMDEAAFEALREIESQRSQDRSTAVDQGWLSKEQQLLEVIGAAVRRKKARHAGMGELENMPNRPMILIDDEHIGMPMYTKPYGMSRSSQHRSLLTNTLPWSAVPAHLLSQRGPIALQWRPFSSMQKSSFHARPPALSDYKPPSTQAAEITNSIESPVSDSPTRTGDTMIGTVAKMTHINSAGEAHMVDVGHKADTKRVAIAVTTVRFENDVVYHQILENKNKKGDVLGVARIAGIMAAKRTSDLIPLCHPIALTRVTVDLDLLAPEAAGGIASTGAGGAVTVVARAECTGATGVEMEALTAASTAGLTIYDMCKAVDRGMETTTALVYKSGGKSGTWMSSTLQKNSGQAFLTKYGLVGA